MPKSTAIEPDLLTQAHTALVEAERMQSHPYTESPEYPARRAAILASLAHVVELRKIHTTLVRIAEMMEEAADA